MKKYRLRKHSPAWYIREISQWAAIFAMGLLIIVGIYGLILLFFTIFAEV